MAWTLTDIDTLKASIATGATKVRFADGREILDKLSDQYAGIYAARAGLERDETRDLMKAETWFDADEAVAKGIATGKVEDLAETTASFDYRIYAHAPKGLPTRSRPKAAPAASTATAKESPTVTTQTYVAGAAVVALTVVGRVTASGKMKKAVKTANDGSQKPVGIAVADVDASAADAVGPTYKMGCFNPSALVIDPSFTVEDVRIAFDGTPLRIRAPLGLTTL